MVRFEKIRNKVENYHTFLMGINFKTKGKVLKLIKIFSSIEMNLLVK
jgi:hypothetical protein